ncbi:UNVERIFIED_CONTAM: hypothetical protein FKN15_073234 [Acipenser sinensis]
MPGAGKNVVKAGRYDGKYPWEAYQAKFKMAALTNGWGPTKKAEQLAAALEGEALQVLLDLGPDTMVPGPERVPRMSASHAGGPGHGGLSLWSDPYCPASEVRLAAPTSLEFALAHAERVDAVLEEGECDRTSVGEQHLKKIA